MIIKYTELEFNIAKYNTLLPLECKQCFNIFYKSKHLIQQFINPKQHRNGDFCSNSCSSNYHRGSKQNVICTNCNINFSKILSEITKNNFCTHSCSATFNNKNKKYGVRRSKLEKFIENKLNIIYPFIDIQYNRKEIINSELDIYIPSLKIAIELNGIFHYKPIYGLNKFNKIKINDNLKIKECIKNNIELHIIDTSTHNYITDTTCKKYLDIVTNIINNTITISKSNVA